MTSRARRDGLKQLIRSRFLKLGEYQSEIYQLKKTIIELQRENRELHKGNRADARKQRADQQHAEFATFVERTAEERGRLSKMCRELRKQLTNEQRKQQKTFERNLQLEEKIQRLEALSKGQHLPERKQLQDKLARLTTEKEALRTQLDKLERYVTNLKKNHAVEQQRLIAEHKARQGGLDQLVKQIEQIELQGNAKHVVFNAGDNCESPQNGESIEEFYA